MKTNNDVNSVDNGGKYNMFVDREKERVRRQGNRWTEETLLETGGKRLAKPVRDRLWKHKRKMCPTERYEVD